MAKKNTRDDFELVEGALSKSEQFIEDNSKMLTIVVGVIIIIAGIYLAYTKLYIAPKQAEALEDMFQAELYFEQDSFRLALEGDGNNFGFLDIIDNFGMSKPGNLAEYYAGVCYLQLGQFDEAITHLGNFSSDDRIIQPMAFGATGDAYAELGDNSQALSFYMKAGNLENDFSSPYFLMKAGLLYETEGQYKEALAAYETIKNDYASSDEGRNIDKYIQRAKMNL
jgi:tetratricopeptide (TPR) repeat protein